MLQTTRSALLKYLWLSAIYTLAPLLIGLLILGIQTAVNQGISPVFYYAWGSTIAALLLFKGAQLLHQRRHHHEPMLSIETDPSWGSIQQDIFEQYKADTQVWLNHNSGFEPLLDKALKLNIEIANQLGRSGQYAHYAVTVPEVLLMVEELARRHRLLVSEQIPMINTVKISSILKAWNFKEAYFPLAHRIYQVFNIGTVAVRPTRAASLIWRELSKELVSKSEKNIVENLRFALLQEVISTSIDLYTGAFAQPTKELQASHNAEHQTLTDIEAIEPVNMAIIGQTSTGKSSITNALLGDTLAEVDALPSTDQAHTYQLNAQLGGAVNITDTAGLDGSKKSISSIGNIVGNCDLIIWTLRADQPAKKIDAEFMQYIDAARAKQPMQRNAKIIVAVTHVEKLALDTKPGSEVDALIDKLSNYYSQLIQFDDICFISKQTDGLSGITDLEEVIEDHFEQALYTKLSRLRQIKKAGTGRKELRRLAKLASSLFKLAVKEKP